MGSIPRGVSASRGASILGLSQWASPFETWQRIMEERFPARPLNSVTFNTYADPIQDGYPGYNAAHGYTLPPDADSAAIRWGLAFEDAICALDEEVLGKRVVFREAAYASKPFFDQCGGLLTCHIDGVLDGPVESPLVLVENKTTTAMSYREKWGDEGTDRIPQAYQIQVQHEMLCTGAAEVIVSVLVFPEMPDAWEKEGWEVSQFVDPVDGKAKHWVMENEYTGDIVHPTEWARVLKQMGYFHQYRVRENHEAQAAMLGTYREWWETYVIGETPPEPRDYADVRRYFPEPVGTVVCDKDMGEWLREMADIKKERGDSGMLGKRETELKVLILHQAGLTPAVLDDESHEGYVFRDQNGKKLGSFLKQTKKEYIVKASTQWVLRA